MSSQPARKNQAAARMSLDELAALPSERLAQLYREGSVPTSLKRINGAPRGRMLDVRWIENTALAPAIRTFAGSSAFVWGGKSFQARSDTRGSGINRVSIPGVLGQQNLFPFDTLIDASSVDGQPAIILDYDKPENPPYIRKIHDEIREVAAGLYLGPAMWKSQDGPVHILWFALDTQVQCA